MSKDQDPVCTDPPRDTPAARKRASQRDWWQREGKHRRSARQANTTADERDDVPGEVEQISRHPEYVSEDNSYAEPSYESFIRAIVRDEMSNKKPMSQTNILLMAAASALAEIRIRLGLFWAMSGPLQVKSPCHLRLHLLLRHRHHLLHRRRHNFVDSLIKWSVNLFSSRFSSNDHRVSSIQRVNKKHQHTVFTTSKGRLVSGFHILME